MIPAGQLKQIVTLQAPQHPTNKLGPAPTTYVDHSNVRAKVRPLSNNEVARYRQVQLDATIEVTIRYRPFITTLWRIKFRNVTYSITSIINYDFKNENLIIIAKNISSGSDQGASPTNIVAPVLSVSVETYSVSLGTWTANPTSYTYQWQRVELEAANDVYTPITGATNSTYTIQLADQGYNVACQVIAHNAYGTGAAYSDLSGSV